MSLPVSSDQSPPPFFPFCSEPHWRRRHEAGKKKTMKVSGPLLRRLCCWTALGRAGGQAGTAAAWGGPAGPAACGSALQSFGILQHLLDERRHGSRNLHLQCDDTLRSFSTDASQISYLHQHLGEHVRFVGPPLPHVNLQRLQKRLLQDVHFVCFF